MNFDFTNNTNTFIFEGIDFSGKSTCSKYFTKLLKERFGEDNVLWVRSPGGSPKAEELRQRTRGADLNIYEQADAYLTCFEHTIDYLNELRVVKDMLFVIDRWTLSYYIYQYRLIQKDIDLFRTIDFNQLRDLQTRYHKIMNYRFGSRHKPLHFNMNLSKDEYLKRKNVVASDRNEDKDRFEKSTTNFQLEILDQYGRADKNKAFTLRYNFWDIDANQSPDKIALYFKDVVMNYFKQPLENK